MRLSSLIRLYPERWRRRYGEEFGALLEHQRQSPRLLADIVRGAILAHARPYPPGGPEMNPRSRVQALGSLVAFVAVLPAVVFVTSAVVAALQPSAFEPSRTAHDVIDWMGAQPGVIVAGLLLVAPAIALVVGSAVLWHGIRADMALRADLAALAAVLVRLGRRPTVVVAVVAVLAAVAVLGLVVDHLIVG
jgi:hypothetical protein